MLKELVRGRKQLARRVEDLELINARLQAHNVDLAARLFDLKQPAAYKPSNKRKLSQSDVKLIHQMKRNGSPNTEIASVFDINRATVSRIVRGIYHKKV